MSPVCGIFCFCLALTAVLSLHCENTRTRLDLVYSHSLISMIFWFMVKSWSGLVWSGQCGLVNLVNVNVNINVNVGVNANDNAISGIISLIGGIISLMSL